jgi:hypothetical protein
MSQENVELARQALAKFVEIDEGLVDPEQAAAEFFAQDVITTFLGFLDDRITLRGADEFLKSAPPGWGRMTTTATSR